MTEISGEYDERQPTRASHTLRETEPGEAVSVSLGFDREKLASLRSEDLLAEDTWDRDERAERLEGVLDVFRKLPDVMNLEAGITAIFGENGAGKTLLADVMAMALQMQVYRQENDVEFGAQIIGRHGKYFYVPLPGRLNGDGAGDYGQQQRVQEHWHLVARIAECMRVYDAAVFSKESFGLLAAYRSPAALGNVALGMSSRQIVDYARKLDGSRSLRARNVAASVIIHDEPELGMSPRRQRGIVEELTSHSQGAVELVPSNSIVLFESDVPRVDLDCPEKGVYTP